MQMPDLLIDGPDSAPTKVILAHGAGAAMDSDFMNFFADGLAKLGYQVIRFEFPYMKIRRLTGVKRPPDRSPVLLSTWQAIVKHFDSNRVVIGGKSMGGRIASMLADEIAVRGLICLGYPFCGGGREIKSRSDHLRQIRTPTLICQGSRDPMGNIEAVSQIKFSKSVCFHWLEDGDHSLKPRKLSGLTQTQNWQDALGAIERFLYALES